MPYAFFHERFPAISAKETRTLTAFNLPNLPAGEYGLFEMYCNEPGCDCRRVLFNVIEENSLDVKAVIGYGWESHAFYAHWLGRDDPEDILEMQGPALNLMSRQSPLAPALLKMMPVILSDTAYVERIKRHYAMFRTAIEQEAGKQIRARSLTKLAEKRPKRPKPTKQKKSRRQKKK